MDQKKAAYTKLHVAIILFGMTAILGDLISLSALPLVWWRVLLTSISILIILGFASKLTLPKRSTMVKFSAVGMIVGLHWLTFYGSIKYSNASVALVAFATVSLFTAFLEPAIMRTKLRGLEVLFGVLVIPCMIMIVKNIDTSMHKGFWVGLLSAFLAAIFGCLNKLWIHKAEPLQITLIEMMSAFFLLSLFLPWAKTSGYAIMPGVLDWIYLLILSLLCTTLAFVLSIKALYVVSAFDANLAINLEPVYGFILAAIILKEHKDLTPYFYIGTTCLLLIVILYPILKSKYVR